MRIAINLRQFYKGKIGGMENYVRNIVEGLRHHDLTIWVHRDEVAHVREFAPTAAIHGITHETGLSEIGAALKPEKFDLFFCPLLVLEPLVVDVPSAVMMPDIQHEFFPEFFDASVLKWRKDTYGPTARNADILFTLSEHAKQTIVDTYGAPAAKVLPIHLDADDEFRAPASYTDSLRLPARYLYFPANFWPHKNHENVLEALRIAVDGGEEIDLVLTGAEAGSENALEQAARLGLASRVHYLGHVAKHLVPEIYRRAQALLFATKFEGFGIPILEAFYCGTPVITSSAGSCVEVAGEAALLVDPLSPESIAGGIVKLLRDAELRRWLVEKGAERVKLFSWASAIERTEKAFGEVVARPMPTRVEVTEWPIIGIVTPTYNMAHFLEETIQSVLSQGYDKLDYVVMDGGSRDGTVAILRKYEDRLRWVSERDGGQGAAINKGWHATHGEIFAYLNADDTYLPGALTAVAKHFRANPKAGLIYGEAYHVDVEGKTLDRYPTRPFSNDALAEQCIICQPAAFLARDAYVEAGMINSSMHFALDYDLWFRVAKKYPVRKVDEYLATSRMHMDNKTLANRWRVFQEILGAVKTRYGYIPQEWVHGYACYLLDRKDQFFDRSRPSVPSILLSLMLGAWYNPHQLRRYWVEWKRNAGISQTFTGRWDDGWISRRFASEVTVGADHDVLRVSGKHNAPIRNLVLCVVVEGQRLDERPVSSNGPFLLEFPLPASVRGKACAVTVEANRTWRPGAGGDYRQLSCVIDELQTVSSRNAS